MKRRSKITGVFNKVVSGSLVMIMVMALLLTGINDTLADPNPDPSEVTILYFEQAGSIIGIPVEIGTPQGALDLPAVLSAVGEIEVEVTETIFTEPEDEDEEPEAIEIVTTEIQTITLNVPVTWEGYYNGDEEGIYVLTAQADGYNYSGEMPTAIITVEDTSVPQFPVGPAGGPQRSPSPAADYVIDLGQGRTPDGIYPGYTITTQNPSRTLEFNTNANAYTYEIIQTATFTSFWTINVNNGVNTTITLNGIDTSTYFGLHGNANLRMLLESTNYIRPNGYITVRENTTLTIDSGESQGSNLGSLSIRNTSTTYAGIGGFYRPTDGTRSNSGHIIINGGSVNVTQIIGQNNVDSAGIGGGGNGSTGTVTINGGYVNVKAETTSSQWNNGALIGGGYGSHGYVTINGGTVIAENIANSTGAAIGGGFGGTGVVAIHNGTVTATIPSGGSGGTGSTGTGAAIGGGKGSGNTSSGIANVTITGGTINATARFGAAIGGGMRSSNATINISGGTINASTVYATGAAIGGGGGGTGSDYGLIGGNIDVTISGGTLNLRTNIGAGIGNGGYERASLPVHTGGLNGLVTITGGTIIADVNEGNGVGTGMDNLVVPALRINKEANILVFGRERTAFAGIYAGDGTAAFNGGSNLGTGYYVNINFPDSGAQMKAGTQLNVFLAGNTSTPYRVIQVANDIGMLSFTTGSDVSQNFNIYAQTSTGTNQLAHPSAPRPNPLPLPANIVYNDGRIYSVKRTFDYYDNGHVHDNWFRSLPLKVGSGGAPLLTVTEKYVDVNGNPIPGKADTQVYIASGSLYDKDIPDDITGYKAVGYKWNTPPTGPGDYTPMTRVTLTITENRTVYFVYSLYTEVDVTVSKQVGGSFASKTMDFTFTVYFTNSSGAALAVGRTFNFEGGIINGSGATQPPNGQLILKAGGLDTFTLKHGQKITIKNVPSDVRIRIVETPASGYTMSYTDSAFPSVKETTEMAFRTVGTIARSFDFLNTRAEAPPLGIEDEPWTVVAFSLIAIVLVASGVGTVELIKRKTR